MTTLVLGASWFESQTWHVIRNLLIFVTPTIVTDEDFVPTQTDFLKKKAPLDRPESDEAGFDNLFDSAKPHDWTKPVY